MVSVFKISMEKHKKVVIAKMLITNIGPMHGEFRKENYISSWLQYYDSNYTHL